MFEKRGVDVVAMFDVSEDIIGKKIGNVKVYGIDELETRIEDFAVDIVILTLPKEYALDTSKRLVKTGIHGIWNFTGKELELGDSRIVVENVHLGDSLMTLCYDVAKSLENSEGK